MNPGKMRLSLVIAVLAPVAVAAQNPVRISTVSGTVFDSIGRAPLAGASVQLLGTSGSANGRMLTATADTLGRFRIDSVPFGDYVAGFFHHAIDSLGIDVKSRAVRVASAQQRIDLASPSPAEMITAFCGIPARNDSTALLIGHVRNAATERGIVGADVLLEWTETTFERGRGVVARERTASARTIADGWFALCGVHTGFGFLMRAAFGPDTTGYVQHESAARAVEHVTFAIGRASWTAIADSLGDTARVQRGAARLAGRILTHQGQPANAQIDVMGTGFIARTNGAGEFTLDSLPPGTRTATIRSIGFFPQDHVIHLAEGRTTRLDLRFAERAVAIAGVEVREQVFSRKLAAFEMNRRRGFGASFYRPGPENALEHATLVTLVQQTPRYSVRFGGGESVALLRLPRSECAPSLWLDGQRFRMGFEQLINTVGPGEMLAVEIYSSPQTMPAQYIENGCGAISVWKKDPPPKHGTPPLRH